MPFYLSRFSSEPETWARLIANPDDRRTAAQSSIGNVSMAALALRSIGRDRRRHGDAGFRCRDR